jgi:hypothetical protein
MSYDYVLLCTISNSTYMLMLPHHHVMLSLIYPSVLFCLTQRGSAMICQDLPNKNSASNLAWRRQAKISGAVPCHHQPSIDRLFKNNLVPSAPVFLPPQKKKTRPNHAECPHVLNAPVIWSWKWANHLHLAWVVKGDITCDHKWTYNPLCIPASAGVWAIEPILYTF